MSISDFFPQTVSESWLLLHDSHVRALAFAIGSAPLIRDWPNPCVTPIELPDTQFWQQQLQRYWPRLQQLDQNPRPLHHALNVRPNIRLGHYFEDLLAFWLSDEGWHEFVLIGHNIQRMDGKRTLGELDFLLENLDTGQIEHWEVCIKFYLGEGLLRPAEWVGLQRQDTLGRKLHHLQHQQFATRRIQGLTIDHRRAVVKGRLFWPSIEKTPAEPMNWLNPDHLRGDWQSTIPINLEHGGFWRRAERLEWLSESATNRAVSQPEFWSNGLYVAQDTDGHTKQRMMLRLDTRLVQVPYLRNMKPAERY